MSCQAGYLLLLPLPSLQACNLTRRQAAAWRMHHILVSAFPALSRQPAAPCRSSEAGLPLLQPAPQLRYDCCCHLLRNRYCIKVRLDQLAALALLPSPAACEGYQRGTMSHEPQTACSAPQPCEGLGLATAWTSTCHLLTAPPQWLGQGMHLHTDVVSTTQHCIS